MKQPVILSIRGCQTYPEQEPDAIEFVTEGVLEQVGGIWELRYEESALTGLEGVTTTFRIENDTIILNRTGKLTSQMIFCEGQVHESLYQMEFGTFLLSVCATLVKAQLSSQGGTIDLVYRIEIEQSTAGIIEYHLDISPKE